MDKDLIARQEVRDLCQKAEDAQRLFADAKQEEVDQICAAMAKAGFRASRRLADLALAATKMGNVEDKTLKNEFSTRDLWDFIKDMKTVGIIDHDRRKKITIIAEPMGVIAGIIPTTNPTSTAMYKAIISVKSRNGLVASPHPYARKPTQEAIHVMAEAAVRAGAPEGLISCISLPSTAAARDLMSNPVINLILSTGGTSIVRAAHSTGKPAYGVGPGNAPAFIETTADVRKAVRDIVIGKSFDNGLICSAENAMIVDRAIEKRALDALKEEPAHRVRGPEREALEKLMVREGGALNPAIIGQSAPRIAELAGLSIPGDTRILVVEQDGVGPDHPLSQEKLSPVLAYYSVNSTEEGINLAAKVVEYGGIGHTAVIHSRNEDAVNRFASRMRACRILVNTPSPHGSVGYTTGLDPAVTLGSGTWGGSITGDNITPLHLINRKRVGWETDPLGPGGVKTTAGSSRGSYSRFDDTLSESRPEMRSPDVAEGGAEELDLKEVDRIAEEFTRTLQDRH
jgi:acetaldehyde dehydrogenase (acetylating)